MLEPTRMIVFLTRVATRLLSNGAARTLQAPENPDPEVTDGSEGLETVSILMAILVKPAKAKYKGRK